MRLDERMTDELQGAQGDSEPQGDPSESKSSAKGCLWIVAALILLPAACIATTSGGGSKWEPTAFEARSICEDWVKDRLKAPSSAKFTDGAESGGGGKYTISGSVDAQNSFGAMIRSTWTCDIRYDTSTEKWRGSATVN